MGPEIPVRKIVYHFVGAIAEIIFLMFLWSKAGALVTTANDMAVAIGALLYTVMVVIIVATVIYVTVQITRQIRKIQEDQNIIR